MDIYRRHNDIYYKPEGKIIHVIRDLKNGDCTPFDYASLKMDDYFSKENNKRFAGICPSLSFDKSQGTLSVVLQIHNKTENRGLDFIMTRTTLGAILAAIAEMTAGEDISDRSGTAYVFGKPINLDGFHKQFMLQMMTPANAELLEFIKTKADLLKKYCRNKTRGTGSVVRAIERMTTADMAELEEIRRNGNGEENE